MVDLRRGEVGIRRARESELEVLWSVRTEAIRGGCAAHYSPELVRAWAAVAVPDGFASALRNDEFFVAEQGGSVRGFGFLNARSREVEGIFVSPSVHRQGIGALLLGTLEERARDLGLIELRLSASLNAEAFYLSAGFVVVQRTVWHHPNGFDLPCVLMEKALVPLARP